MKYLVIVYLIGVLCYEFYILKDSGGLDKKKVNTVKKKISFFIQTVVLFPTFAPLVFLSILSETFEIIWNEIIKKLDNWSSFK